MLHVLYSIFYVACIQPVLFYDVKHIPPTKHKNRKYSHSTCNCVGLSIITSTCHVCRFVDSLMYYGLSLNMADLSGNVFFNSFLSGAVEVPANLLCVALLNWPAFGRRLTCSFALLAAGLSSFVCIPFILNSRCLFQYLFRTLDGVLCVFLSLSGRRLTWFRRFLLFPSARPPVPPPSPPSPSLPPSLPLDVTMMQRYFPDMDTSATVMAMLGKASVTVGYSAIYVFSTEIFPTEVRNAGLGSSSTVARISGMIAPFIGGPIVRQHASELLINCIDTAANTFLCVRTLQFQLAILFQSAKVRFSCLFIEWLCIQISLCPRTACPFRTICSRNCLSLLGASVGMNKSARTPSGVKRCE